MPEDSEITPTPPFEEPTPLHPERTQSEGALAHEAAGYSLAVPKPPGAEISAGESPTQIPVTAVEPTERIPGVNAPEGDPPYVDPQSPAVEQNPARAEAMALAGDSRRTHAAESRQMTPIYEEEEQIYRSNNEIENSKWQDRMAQREEHWAGILHDHPLSAGFKRKANVWIDGKRVKEFSPEALIELEETIADYSRIIDDIKSGRASVDPRERLGQGQEQGGETEPPAGLGEIGDSSDAV